MPEEEQANKGDSQHFFSGTPCLRLGDLEREVEQGSPRRVS